MSLKQLLTDHRAEILASFVRDVERKDLPPPGTSRSELIDHIPVFLDELIAELSREDGARPSLDATELNATARQHGAVRWKVGYDLEAVVREYGVLRHSILQAVKAANASLSIDETDALARYLNLGVTGATAEYVRVREEQLRARQADLEFLSEAGELLSSSLDYQSTVSRLTRLLVPRLADFCVVCLDGRPVDEIPIAHADPGKLTLLREVLRGFLPECAPSHAEVARTGKPLIVESRPEGFLEGVAKSPEHLSLLRQLGVCSWLVVPLTIKTNMFGTITLAWSDSGRHYKSSDLLLAEDLARRAASAIDNAQLYKVSREERVRAEAATRTKDEFVAMISHELRTPLNAMIGWIHLLRGRSLSEKQTQHALEVLERSANEQSRLVSDLLETSRVLTGKVRLEPTQVDFSSVVARTLEDARFALEAKSLALHAQLAPAPLVTLGDADRLKQVVWNILLNAIKFTSKGGEIRVSLRQVESDLELVVADTGIGIDNEFLPHVFETFRQFDSKITRVHGGLGIGLSISKHLVDLHGGQLEARSDGVGKGASFLLRLPVIPVRAGVAKLPATTPERPAPTHPQLAGMSVLVVDDQDDARDLLRAILESCDIHVHDAASADIALAKLAAEHVDLVVSDIGMPEADGYAFIRKVRALPNREKANIPAIALTAFARGKDRSQALLEGYNLYIAKPVTPSELLSAIADLRESFARGGA